MDKYLEGIVKEMKQHKDKIKGNLKKEKKIYYSDLENYVEVCYSCSGQNINITDNGEKSFCKDCKSEDIGAVAPDEVI
tara:strand:- start:60 stop:293 length:234 start_codon:yes stop_codon:yes gene_type:complete